MLYNNYLLNNMEKTSQVHKLNRNFSSNNMYNNNFNSNNNDNGSKKKHEESNKTSNNNNNNNVNFSNYSNFMESLKPQNTPTPYTGELLKPNSLRKYAYVFNWPANC